MTLTRSEICRQTAAKLQAATSGLPNFKVLVGFDGFVDEIISVVDKRHQFDSFEPLRTIEQLGRKISGAAGRSSNLELVVKHVKLGGNGPIMANALAAFGVRTRYIGALGHPNLHPVFQELAAKAEVISVAEPGHTDALEFEDGKVMLGKYTTLNDVNWKVLTERVGLAQLRQLIDESALTCTVNWTMLPAMSDIWQRLLDEVFSQQRKAGQRLFVDLADPEKRLSEDILGALALLGRFQERVDVTLGLNLKESLEIAGVLGLSPRANPETVIEQLAFEIRQRLDLHCVVIHPRAGAAAATASGTAHFAGPFVQQPKISTGAGDHFNAGFALGQLLGFNLEESLCTGVATSGYYVRTGESPAAAQLAEFIAELPPPQPLQD